MVRRFRRKNVFFPLFFNKPIAGTPRLVCRKHYANSRRYIRLREANIKSHLTPKVDPILKRSKRKATTQIINVFRTKVQISESFFEDKPWNLAHVFYRLKAPTQSLTTFFFFFAGNFVSLKTQISPLPQRKKKLSSRAWKGLVEHVCQVPGSIPTKRRGHWMLI